ncbi:MarR family winged helix-turn-helix transcriptional regulator [Microbacterium sp. GXF7504]
MTETRERSASDEVMRAAERLRLAEARLSRRRQQDCGPGENARAAMRFVYERADAGDAPTPTAIAEHLGISTPAVTGILDRLRAGGVVAFERNPRDGRSKLVVPFDRTADLEDVDPLTAQLRRLADDIPPEAAPEVAAFLARLTEAVDRECA